MRGIRRWLSSAALLTGTTALAQSPAPADEPAIATALPGGTVVGSNATPTSTVSVLPTVNTPKVAVPSAAAPIDIPPPSAVPVAPPAAGLGAPALLVPVPGGAPVAGCAAPTGDCCGPIGAHGPIGQEVYSRLGASFPLGNGLLARGLNIGYVAQIGGRAQYFDPPGDSAWTADLHITYTYNDGGGQDVATVRNEPVTVRALHRSAVGFGFGRDHFLAGPGFVGGMWDANLRWGWDAGGRWGAGHVDLNPILQPGFYRRHYDVFGQPYLGVHSTLDVPVGGWTWIVGGRVEANYTFSDILPKDGSFYEVTATLVLGLRY
jgi:hypothetical protein